MPKEEKQLYILMVLLIALFAGFGILSDGPESAIRGLIRLQYNPARLINDFTLPGGVGGALVNAALAGALALGLIRIAAVRLSGPTIAAVCTIMGFSLFGKTPLNALPIVLGVFAVGVLIKKPFKNNFIIALFGTALGPLTTYLAFESGLPGVQAIALGILGGFVAGMFLPALARAMLRLHEGFNLYNVGLTAGFLALFAAALVAGSGGQLELRIVWNDVPSAILMGIVPLASLLFILWGLCMEGPKKAYAGFLFIQRMSGRLPSDFMELASPGASLLNSGILGILGCFYVFAVGGDFNGPTVGALMTLFGFGLFGKNLRNCWPVVAGVAAATLLFGKSLDAPGPLLAALFGTTLAPLAGQFGPGVGFIAGFLHLAMVERTAAWHGGLDLYNNGFAGGLVATFMVAIIEWLKTNTTILSSKK